MHPLKRKRLAKDLTQAGLAEKLGVTGAAVSAWETGQRIPEPGLYAKLSKVLGITPDEVVSLFSEPAAARD